MGCLPPNWCRISSYFATIHRDGAKNKKGTVVRVDSHMMPPKDTWPDWSTLVQCEAPVRYVNVGLAKAPVTSSL